MSRRSLLAKALAAAAVFLACVPVRAEEPDTSELVDKYLGLRYVETPKDVRVLQRGGEGDPFWIHVRAQGTDMLWLEASEIGKRGKNEFVVLDVAVLPPLKPGEEVTDNCVTQDVDEQQETDDEGEGERVIGIGRFGGKPGPTHDIAAAWTLNARDRSLEPFDGPGLTCSPPAPSR